MSDGRPLITVILACFNQEQFVGEAVDGLLEQTYAPLETVVVDDCSTDATADVIRSRLARHPRGRDVHFVSNERNLTGPVCCRMALSITKGPLVLISHGDDVMLPEMVAEIADVWLRENVSLVSANALYIDDHSKSLNRMYVGLETQPDISFETLARDGANHSCFMPTMAFERDLYSAFGWPHDLLGAADIMFPFYAHLRKGVRFIRKPLLKYRVHSQNTSLSLQLEKSHLAALTNERIYQGHLAHAVLMQEQLQRLAEEAPQRYLALYTRIDPLLKIQIVEMAKKLVKNRIENYDGQHENRGS
jgi:glycosyltransferase involved in cell wall biosynthesis